MRVASTILSSLLIERPDLTNFVTPSYRTTIESAQQQPSSLSDWLNESFVFLTRIDSSWLSPTQQDLQHLCTSEKLSVATFAQSKLWEELAHKDISPFLIAEKNPLGCLLNIRHPEDFFQFLGLYDLGLELVRVVQTKTIQAIQNALTKEQTRFLAQLAKRPSSVDFGQLGLHLWDGSVDALRDMLLKRGMNRFAKSLYGVDASLIWYLQHFQNKALAEEWSLQISDLGKQEVHNALRSEVKTVYEAMRGDIT